MHWILNTEKLSEVEKAQITARLRAVGAEMSILQAEATSIKEEAQRSHFTGIARNAESLSGTLHSAR